LSHDAALKATAQLLAATKRFSEDAHDEFKGFVEATEKKDRKNKEQFERTDERITHLSTMLTETINRLNTHANHLRTTNGAVRPLQEHFDKMATSQHQMTNTQRDHGAALDRLQRGVDLIHLHIDEMTGKLGKSDSGKGVRDVYEEVLRLKTTVEHHSTTMSVMESNVNGAVQALPNHDKRLLLLEQGNDHNHDQIKHLQNTIGVEKKEVPPPPPLKQEEQVVQTRAVPLPKRIIKEGPDIMKRKAFIDVVNQVSMRERQKQYKDRLEEQGNQLENVQKGLNETNKELHDKMGLRVKMLEAKMNNLVPTVDQLKNGMELTEEYWKGLSHGLRESHKMVAVDKELIKEHKEQPRSTSARGKALPALSPQAAHTQRGSTPARTQDPRTAWGTPTPSGRPPSAGRYPVGLAR